MSATLRSVGAAPVQGRQGPCFTPRTGFRVAGVLALAGMLACGGDGGTVTPPVPDPPPSPPSVAAVTLAAARDSVPVGEPVAVTATARSSSGSGIGGVSVTFSTAPASGSVEPTTATTSANGSATATWTLGAGLGGQSLTASANNISSALTIQATPGAPASIRASSDTAFTGVPGAPLADPVEVEIQDRFGHVLAGVPVVFRVVAGEGTVSPDTAVTSANGLAETTWTLGPAPGENQLQAHHSGLDPVDFSATAVRDQVSVTGAAQTDWPDSDVITLTGYNLDRLSARQLLVNGGPPRRLEIRSPSEARVLPFRHASGDCVASFHGVISVILEDETFQADVRILGGEGAQLAPLEEYRADNLDCLRIFGASDSSRYVLAVVERSYIDNAEHTAEEWNYDGGFPFVLNVEDTGRQTAPHTVAAQATQRALPARGTLVDDVHMRVHDPAMQPAGSESLWERTTPLRVGNTFEWLTGDDRSGTFRVMATYPPNIVLAVFEADMSRLWNDARAAAMDSVFTLLGSPAVQELYATVFGPDLPVTSPHTGQMIVMFHDGPPHATTGVTYSAPDAWRYTTVHFRRAEFEDTNLWYRPHLAHELAHARHAANIRRFSGVWSGEGIANFFSDEELRLAAGLPLDANRDAYEPLLGWYQRLPSTGDFVSGYGESDSFLRFLVERLVLKHGRPYESAIRRVVAGAASGWYGRYFVNYYQPSYDSSLGLTRRMQEIVPDWDPVEARLDWIVSYALDDRSDLDGYYIAFLRDAWRHYPPAATVTLGAGAEISVASPRGGGNYYFLLEGGGDAAALKFTTEILSDEPHLAWKLVRYR